MKLLPECEEMYFLIPGTGSWAFQETFSGFGNLSSHAFKFMSIHKLLHGFRNLANHFHKQSSRGVIKKKFSKNM